MSNTTIQLKHSTVQGNVPVSLANGEISINSRDGIIFYADPTGTIQQFTEFPGPSGLDTEVQFNDGGILNGDSKFTFNKTTGQLTVQGTVRANLISDDGTDLLTYTTNSFNQANAAFVAANNAFTTSNGTIAWNTANAAFTAANNRVTSANGQIAWNTANAAFTRANNSLDANNGGTVTGTITATGFITTGSYGNITGANNIFANTFIANTGGYIQFADGTKQYTANAGGSSGPTGNSFGVIYTSNNSTFANAITANDQVTFIGVDGVTVNANATTKTITFAGTPGAQGLTVDYGLVTESLAYSLDYGTL